MTTGELYRILAALGPEVPVVLGCHAGGEGKAHPIVGGQIAQVVDDQGTPGATVFLLVPQDHEPVPAIPTTGRPALQVVDHA